ncbi:40S ribosomal protein S17-2 [Dissostichus eleginoides]|uniref:40S ribosomal protein S17-2 n=1 Tax=Dissostichus eleginoides TaxID=100907 RepID=A0AAD9C5I5_DISEL|nr:40S ribosomal protein S17-2 [Dissostichus eleginoides]
MNPCSLQGLYSSSEALTNLSRVQTDKTDLIRSFFFTSANDPLIRRVRRGEWRGLTRTTEVPLVLAEVLVVELRHWARLSGNNRGLWKQSGLDAAGKQPILTLRSPKLQLSSAGLRDCSQISASQPQQLISACAAFGFKSALKVGLRRDIAVSHAFNRELWKALLDHWPL